MQYATRFWSISKPATRIFFLNVLFVFVVFPAGYATEKKWTGLANDGLWSSSGNWSDNQLPAPEDDVVFDNSFFAGDYSVLISGQDSIQINSLVISPGEGILITVTIDKTSARQVALNVSASLYSLVINKGGTLINASGVSSGAVINLADSLQVNNGGVYRHQTRRPHAALVAKLSRSAGTEKGIFEFNLPSGTGTLSLSSRVYGTLVLSATEAGGARNYTATGSNSVTINGDLIINPGVNLSLDLASMNGNLLIKGSCIHNGNSMNLASGAGDISTVRIAGDVMLSPASTITESNSGFPVIELNGLSSQQVSFGGGINNNVSIRINNPAGIILRSPLSLPYQLELVNGSITSTADKLLTLQAACSVLANSNGNSFINGPLKKEGLTGAGHFIFPVGKANAMAWLALNDATGDFTVEYVQDNPGNLATRYGAGIDHVSTHDYWIIGAAAANTASGVELSFRDGSSYGITDIATLRVTQLTDGIWTDRGNASTSGTAGGSGSVTSSSLHTFDPVWKYFAIAASTANQNPLPVTIINLAAFYIDGQVTVNWEIDLPNDSAYFIMAVSDDNLNFHPLDRIAARALQTKYQFSGKPVFDGTNYYRLQVTDKDGNSYYSKIVSIINPAIISGIHISSYQPGENNLGLNLQSPGRNALQLLIINNEGEVFRKMDINVEKGENRLLLDISMLPAGVYYLSGGNQKQRTNTVKFVRQ